MHKAWLSAASRRASARKASWSRVFDRTASEHLIFDHPPVVRPIDPRSVDRHGARQSATDCLRVGAPVAAVNRPVDRAGHDEQVRDRAFDESDPRTDA